MLVASFRMLSCKLFGCWQGSPTPRGLGSIVALSANTATAVQPLAPHRRPPRLASPLANAGATGKRRFHDVARVEDHQQAQRPASGSLYACAGSRQERVAGKPFNEPLEATCWRR